MMRNRPINIFPAYTDFLATLLVLVLAITQITHKANEGIKVHAEYIVTASWDRMSNSDVDLYGTIPPDEEHAAWYRNKEVGNLLLDHDSIGWTTDRIIDLATGITTYRDHVEIITMRGIIPGKYSFAIHLYNLWKGSAKDDTKTANIKVHLTITKLNPKAETIYSGDTILNFIGDEVNFFSMRVLADGTYQLAEVPVMPIPDKFLARVGTPGYTGTATSPPQP